MPTINARHVREDGAMPRHAAPRGEEPYLGTLMHVIANEKSLNVVDVIAQIEGRGGLAEAAPELCRSLRARWEKFGAGDWVRSIPKAVAAMGHHGQPLAQKCLQSLQKSHAMSVVKGLSVAIAAAGSIPQIITGVTVAAARCDPTDRMLGAWNTSRSIGERLGSRLGLDLCDHEQELVVGLHRIAITGSSTERWFSKSVLFSMGASGEDERSWGRCLAMHGRPQCLESNSVPGEVVGQATQIEVSNACATDLSAWSVHLVRTKRSHLLAQESGILNAVGALAITGRTPWSNEPLRPETHSHVCAQFAEISSGFHGES